MRLHVHEWGDAAAPPVVCVHGVSAHGRRFRKLAEERLAARFRVLAPDLRGHGRSAHDPPWDLATHGRDLLETLDGEPALAWVGHSFGGRLVLELAAREPERIRCAVLLDPAIQILPHVG
jgi:lipase